jgi:hypothetical protein
MRAIESFKPLGPLSIFIIWVIVAILVTRWPRDSSKSISRHAASNKKAYLMMAAAETLTLSMFLFFCFFWLIPTFSLPLIFSICITLAGIGLVIASWLPDTIGLMHRIHVISAYGAAAFFVPSLISLILDDKIPTVARVFSGVATLYMLAAIIAFIFYPKTKEHHLVFQGIYIMSFHVCILLTVFLK